MFESLCSSPIGAQTMYHDQRSKWTDWPRPGKFSQSAGFLKFMAFAVPPAAAAGRDWNIFHSLLPFSWEPPPPPPPLAASLQSGHCIPKCTPDAKIPGISLCGEVREDWEAVGQVKVNGCLYCRTSQNFYWLRDIVNLQEGDRAGIIPQVYLNTKSFLNPESQKVEITQMPIS